MRPSALCHLGENKPCHICPTTHIVSFMRIMEVTRGCRTMKGFIVRLLFQIRIRRNILQVRYSSLALGPTACRYRPAIRVMTFALMHRLSMAVEPVKRQMAGAVSTTMLPSCAMPPSFTSPVSLSSMNESILLLLNISKHDNYMSSKTTMTAIDSTEHCMTRSLYGVWWYGR